MKEVYYLENRGVSNLRMSMSKGNYDCYRSYAYQGFEALGEIVGSSVFSFKK